MIIMKGRAHLVAAIVIIIAAIQISNVQADVPTVLSITRRMESGNLFVDVKVRHANPSTSHYIDDIKIDSDGSVKEYSDLQRATTTEHTFSINLGQVNPKLIKAQAICNIHGPSAYLQESSTGGSIPGYPIGSFAIGFAASILIYSLLKRRETPNF